MNGLLIKDPIHWRPTWSSEIGQRLEIKDSTQGLFVFDPKLSRDEILEALKDIPAESFSLIELEEVAQKDCEFTADSGLCYRRTPN
ncbi:hypothetical protein SAMN05660860_02962 [Geoalkalibacter ferrihydriticus]|uniref:Uncharacterized protein n=2 Tax=Geoalkalibacter ferrihydriticus TaxID=392333 RepID=A0A0C2HLE8_9BACT|nr:hypothetical protein [Geoalkalibacter ferrihydriticus]KIH75820.1 hypothetical protein GFER_14615 [Geoalkalibacter ferrihydriticus DSM 17813]SDM66498.1 hypothetical protein SAMN05660860_02962 [Geoalkalibacter ferrihydriticus]